MTTNLYRFLLRAGKTYVKVHLGVCTFMAALAHLPDEVGLERWRRGERVVSARAIAPWSASKLTRGETECLDTWLSLMRFDFSPTLMDGFSPFATLEDTMVSLSGVSEIADAYQFLGHWCACSCPVVTAIVREKREMDGVERTIIHARIETDVWWIPFPFKSLTFCSMASLELEPARHGRRLRIRNVEQRWWGGYLMSERSHSMGRWYGRFGDFFRRVNGLALSFAETNTSYVLQRNEKV
jgi:hypothetical protein